MFPLSRSLRALRSRARRALRPGLEDLETRSVPAVLVPTLDAGAVFMQPAFRRAFALPGATTAATAVLSAGLPQYFSTHAPYGFTPQQVRAAYDIDGLFFGAIQGDGTGQTIAIVDAYDNPAC